MYYAEIQVQQLLVLLKKWVAGWGRILIYAFGRYILNHWGGGDSAGYLWNNIPHYCNFFFSPPSPRLSDLLFTDLQLQNLQC